MRRRTFALALFSSALSLSGSVGVARADGECGGSASGCFPSDSYWPAAGVSDLAFVASPQVIERRIGLGIHTSYLKAPIVARVPSPGIPTDVAAIEHQVVFTPFVSYAPTKAIEIATFVPASVQSGGGAGVLSGADPEALTLRDARLDVRVDGRQLFDPLDEKDRLERGKRWSYGLHATVAFPLAAPKNFSGDRTVVLAPSFVVQRDEGSCFFGVETGGRLRGVTEFAGSRLGHQLFLGFGFGCDLVTHPREKGGKRALFSFSAEGMALPTFVDQTVVDPSGRVGNRVASRYFVPAEWLLSVKTSLSDSVDLRLAGGGALGGWTGQPGDLGVTGGGAMGLAPTTPQLRAILGVAYHFDPAPPK